MLISKVTTVLLILPDALPQPDLGLIFIIALAVFNRFNKISRKYSFTFFCEKVVIFKDFFANVANLQLSVSQIYERKGAN